MRFALFASTILSPSLQPFLSPLDFRTPRFLQDIRFRGVTIIIIIND